MRALVVEDDQMVAEFIVNQLNGLGYDVTLVDYSNGGMSKECREKYKLAIVDGLDGDGMMVLEAVDAERKILYTGDDELEKKAKEAGIEVHLKPMSLKEILGAKN